MRAVAIIIANSDYFSIFLKLKIHKAEMANLVTWFLHLHEKNLKIAIDNS